MRFAATADVHGNYLALEAVLADIRTQGIKDIVNLGDMASGALDARRTMDILLRELPPGRAAATAAQLTGATRAAAYALATRAGPEPGRHEPPPDEEEEMP